MVNVFADTVRDFLRQAGSVIVLNPCRSSSFHTVMCRVINY